MAQDGMDRGHIWTSRKFREAPQRQALLAAGVAERVIYVDEIDDVINALRANDRLVVAGFRGLGRNRAVIAANITRIHAKRCCVADAESGRLSTGKYCIAMIEDAVRALANERRGPHKKTKRDRRMPEDQMVVLYFDKRLSNAELEAAVTARGKYSEVSYHTMRRIFGRKRDAITGRPSKDRVATIL